MFFSDLTPALSYEERVKNSSPLRGSPRRVLPEGRVMVR